MKKLSRLLRDFFHGFAFGFALTIVMLVLTQGAHCTTHSRRNSLGILQTYESPWMYMLGAPIRVNLFEAKGYYYTNVEFKPVGASLLNTASVMFCGDQMDVFGDERLRVVTYRINVTRSYQGVGCHDILPGQMGIIVIEGDNQ